MSVFWRCTNGSQKIKRRRDLWTFLIWRYLLVLSSMCEKGEIVPQEISCEPNIKFKFHEKATYIVCDEYYLHVHIMGFPLQWQTSVLIGELWFIIPSSMTKFCDLWKMSIDEIKVDVIKYVTIWELVFVRQTSTS